MKYNAKINTILLPNPGYLLASGERFPSHLVSPNRESALRALKLWVGKSQKMSLSVVSVAHNSLGTSQAVLAGQTASGSCASQNVGNAHCALSVCTSVHPPVWYLGGKNLSQKWFLVLSICSPKLVFKMGEVCIKRKKKNHTPTFRNIDSDSWNYLCLLSFSSQFKFPCRPCLCSITVNTANWCDFNTA